MFDEENELENFSTDELQKELDKRHINSNKTPVVSVDNMYAEYTCPDCGHNEQTEMFYFDDDGIREVYCEACNFNFIVDLDGDIQMMNKEDNDSRWLDNVLFHLSTDELRDELEKRDMATRPAELEVVPAGTIWVEFSCPECGTEDSVDMDAFDDDGTVEIHCGGCGNKFLVDLGEGDIDDE